MINVEHVNKVELSKSSQDIILACKGRYDASEEETIFEKFQRVVAYITGGDKENTTMSAIIWWLSNVYIELLDIEGTEMRRYELAKFLRGESVYQEKHFNYGYEELGEYFWFLRDSISSCRCRNSKTGFELVLNENPDLETEYSIRKAKECEESNKRALKGELYE